MKKIKAAIIDVFLYKIIHEVPLITLIKPFTIIKRPSKTIINTEKESKILIPKFYDFLHVHSTFIVYTVNYLRGSPWIEVATESSTTMIPYFGVFSVALFELMENSLRFCWAIK